MVECKFHRWNWDTCVVCGDVRPRATEQVRLPCSPSTNNLFVNKKVGGRFISPAYKSWRDTAGMYLNLARIHPFGAAPVEVSLTVPRKPASRDLDNFAKAPIDLLVAHAIINDDKQIERLTISRHDLADMLLQIAPYSALQTQAGK